MAQRELTHEGRRLLRERVSEARRARMHVGRYGGLAEAAYNEARGDPELALAIAADLVARYPVAVGVEVDVPLRRKSVAKKVSYKEFVNA